MLWQYPSNIEDRVKLGVFPRAHQVWIEDIIIGDCLCLEAL